MALLLPLGLLAGCDSGPSGSANPPEAVTVNLDAPASAVTDDAFTLSAEARAETSDGAEAPVDSLKILLGETELASARDTTALTATVDSSMTSVGRQSAVARAWKTAGGDTVTDQATQTVQITTVPPTAQFSVEPDSGRAPLDVTISGEGQDPDGPAPTGKVDVDNDGNVEYSRTVPFEVQHTFPEGDTVETAYWTVDADGATSDTLRDTVRARPERHALTLRLHDRIGEDVEADTRTTYHVDGRASDVDTTVADGDLEVTVSEGAVILGAPTTPDGTHYDTWTFFESTGSDECTPPVAYTDQDQSTDTLRITEDTRLRAHKIRKSNIQVETPHGGTFSMANYAEIADNGSDGPPGTDIVEPGENYVVWADSANSNDAFTEQTKDWLRDTANNVIPKLTNNCITASFKDGGTEPENPYNQATIDTTLQTSGGAFQDTQGNIIKRGDSQFNPKKDNFDRETVIEEVALHGIGNRSQSGSLNRIYLDDQGDISQLGSNVNELLYEGGPGIDYNTLSNY